ncbi:MAG: molybdate ABC transporter substrate-binding protein [Chloroflexota bacterium]
MRRHRWGLLAAALLWAGAACSDAPPSLTIAAASDLAPASVDLEPLVEAECDVDVSFVLGSSGQLRDQVRAGAPYDLFLSADRGFVDGLAQSGDIDPTSVRDYAVGGLALAWRDGLPPLATLDDLRRADIERIAIASPEHAPYGRAARQALEAADLWDALQPRIVIAENIRQASEYLRSGNVDAALLSHSLVVQPARAHLSVDSALHAPLVQASGVVARSAATEAAACVLRVIAEGAGQDVLARYGFESPVAAP